MMQEQYINELYYVLSIQGMRLVVSDLSSKYSLKVESDNLPHPGASWHTYGGMLAHTGI